MASSSLSSSLLASSLPHLQFPDASLSMVLNGLTAAGAAGRGGENLQEERGREAVGRFGGARQQDGADDDSSFFSFFLADPRISPGLHNTLCLLVVTCLFLWFFHLLRRLLYAKKLYRHFLVQQVRKERRRRRREKAFLTCLSVL